MVGLLVKPFVDAVISIIYGSRIFEVSVMDRTP
jgi:hypothetical protein